MHYGILRNLDLSITINTDFRNVCLCCIMLKLYILICFRKLERQRCLANTSLTGML